MLPAQYEAGTGMGPDAQEAMNGQHQQHGSGANVMALCLTDMFTSSCESRLVSLTWPTARSSAQGSVNSYGKRS
ncbi:hypothetical protein BaRGS_00003479 [Batillaria attramentaria]|uniref:Uncharacterized protein n=1 Tax=Batillaria attramentaria TaxID=370345 RepID=A0ABD0M280_9CAEN